MIRMMSLLLRVSRLHLPYPREVDGFFLSMTLVFFLKARKSMDSS